MNTASGKVSAQHLKCWHLLVDFCDSSGDGIRGRDRRGGVSSSSGVKIFRACKLSSRIMIGD